MDKLSLEHHINHLEQRHKEMDQKIKDGYTHYMDDTGLSKMKQEKAHVRRQIEETKEKLTKL